MVSSVSCYFSSDVYTVKPDYRYGGDYECPNNVNSANQLLCGSLQHFLVMKNQFQETITTLQFEHGDHYLNGQLVINGLTRFTLRGKKYGVVTIKCGNIYGRNISLMFEHVSNLLIDNLRFQNCGTFTKHSYLNSVICIKSCGIVTVNEINIENTVNSGGVMLVNTQEFHFTNSSITINNCFNDVHYGLMLNFTSAINYNSFTLASISFYSSPTKDCGNYGIGIIHKQIYKSVYIFMTDLFIGFDSSFLYYYSYSCASVRLINHHLTFNASKIQYKRLSSSLFHIEFEECWLKDSSYYSRQQSTCSILFSHCQVTNNVWSTVVPLITINTKFSVLAKSKVFILNCTFSNNKNMLILKVLGQKDVVWPYTITISITNMTVYSNILKQRSSFFLIKHTYLTFNGLTVRNNTGGYAILQLDGSVVIYEKNVKFVHNKIHYLMTLANNSFMTILDSSRFVVYNNSVRSLFTLIRDTHDTSSYPCIVQLISRAGILNVEEFSNLYNITIANNTERRSRYFEKELFNSAGCEIIPGAAFTAYPSTNISTIFKNNVNIKEHEICNCKSANKLLCAKNELQARYPGQTVTSFFAITHRAPNITLTVDNEGSSCKVLNHETEQSQPNNCSEFHYTITSDNERKCTLYLTERNLQISDRFKIQLKRCPLGFSLSTTNNRTCQCDQLLSQASLPISCDINNEMILRPSNSWISGKVENEHEVHDYKYIYQVLLSCPYDYCSPLPSYINLNRPDTQCNFNRTGSVCGHCPLNYSRVFGSSNCKLCSNDNLKIILPVMALAGIVLVLLIYALDVTVTSGVVNTFILYFNLVGINSSQLLPSTSSIPLTLLHIVISLANFNLGIKTCFYDGMNDYVILWLQLAFPVYLIIISTTIIAVGHCIKIACVQRIISQRGFPVLATVLLLMYTKLLITSFMVLFSYTRLLTISKTDHTTQFVWSVSSDIDLFGTKHASLFAVNIIILLMLILGGAILLFCRPLTRYSIFKQLLRCRMMNCIIPLLDAYKAPYKDMCYFWIGYQLLIRVSMVTISQLLNKPLTLAITTLIIGVAICVHGYVCPFKNKLLNVQELVALFNVFTVYVLVMFRQTPLFVQITEGIGVLQFITLFLYQIFAKCQIKSFLMYLLDEVKKKKKHGNVTCCRNESK